MLSKNLTELIKNSIYSSKQQIPLHEPHFDGVDEEHVSKCIKSTFVSSSGEFIDQFEKDICEYTGASYTSVFSNGTSALHLALLGNDVSDQHEVITQSLTFVATLNAISYVGAKALLIDVSDKDLGIDPELLEKWLDRNTFQKNGACINKISNRIIKACMPMHTFGIPSNIIEISRICSKHNIILIEDCAESLGSYFNKIHLGLFGSCGILSFNGNKIITTGGGGAIISNNYELMKKIRHIGTTAKLHHSYEFIHDIIGYNYRMPNLNAALGVSQIKKLYPYLESKKKISKQYKDFFRNYTDVTFIDTSSNNASPNYWLNTVIFSSQNERDEVLQFLHSQNIFVRIPWKPMHLLDIHDFQEISPMHVTEKIYSRGLNLPSSPNLS